MSDSAEGPISGFLYQFQKALLILSKIGEPNGGISIENVDDIAVHDESDVDKILITYQAKHSLSLTGSSFSDTSKALWRTLEIWIEKLEDKTFDSDTKFVCATNRPIPADSLLHKMVNDPFDQVFAEIKNIQAKLKMDVDEKIAQGEPATIISVVLKKINLAIRKKTALEQVLKNISYEVKGDIKPEFLEVMRLTHKDIPAARQDLIHETLYGWLISTCQYKWKNNSKAFITKEMFDSKWTVLNSNPQIMTAIFRKKNELGTLTDSRRLEVIDELFVKQINDIERGPGKKFILERAMLDFIHHKIEMSFVITKGDFTETDFEAFEEQCKEVWGTHFFSKVLKDKYDEPECNSIAIEVFDGVMNDDKLKFDEGFVFSPSNKYIKNGSFLKLSNVPDIGWRPDWEFKYKEDGKG